MPRIQPLAKNRNTLVISVRSNDQKALAIAKDIDTHDEEVVCLVRKILTEITSSPDPRRTAQIASNLLEDSRAKSLYLAGMIGRVEKVH